MPRRGHTSAERVFCQEEELEAGERLRYSRPVEPRWSDFDEGVTERRRPDSEEESFNQVSNDRRGHRYNEHGEPQSPPLPYSEHDHQIGGGEMLPNSGFNLYPGESGRPVYITDSSGRRERYVENERGERVPWPLPDHIDSSDDGDGDSDMVHLESGRVLPRSEWEATHPCHPSSDESSSDDTDGHISQTHRYPMPRTRTSPSWTSEHESSPHEAPRVRSEHSPAFRQSGRRGHAGRGGRCHHHIAQERRQDQQPPEHHSGRY